MAWASRERKERRAAASVACRYILVYPQGCDVCNHLSLFLCVADYDKLLPGAYRASTVQSCGRRRGQPTRKTSLGSAAAVNAQSWQSGQAQSCRQREQGSQASVRQQVLHTAVCRAGWSHFAQFTIAVTNKDPKKSKYSGMPHTGPQHANSPRTEHRRVACVKPRALESRLRHNAGKCAVPAMRADTLHRFCKKEHDWGWKKFMELSKVLDGFTVSDTLIIKAQVQVIL